MLSVVVLAIKASVILSVFAIGLKATFADATYLFRRPGQLFRALVSMNVLMPAIAVAVVMPFDLHPAVKIAVAAISVSPSPPIFPKKALRAGGTASYTIGLLVAAAVLSIAVIPATIEVFQRITGESLDMRPREVAVLVGTTILAPLFAGIAARRIAPAAADRFAPPINTVASVSLVLGGVAILIALSGPVISFVKDGRVLTLTIFTLAGLIVGHMLGGPEPDNRAVLALATASRHPAMGLAIAHANFPDQKLAGVAVALYLIVSSILSLLYLSWVKRRRARRAA